jgi:DNA repair exonuclease SbcCD nuclease subunit
MKFLHAADIHLDSPMRGLLSRGDLPANLIEASIRRAFQVLITLAIDEDVAFVVIAGDLYDREWEDARTWLFFVREMRRLARPCFLLRGNHDARSVITRDLRPPENLFEFSADACQTHVLESLGVALHGHSFAGREVTNDISRGYPAPIPGMFNIGVLHTSAEDSSGDHETYAPCSVSALAAKGYDYWALGHIHARRVLSEKPWIVFPGNLQGRHVRETGPKGCTLVTVQDGRVATVEHRTLDVLRWASVDIDLTGTTDEARPERIAAAFAAAREASDGRDLLARVIFTGTTDQHDWLAANHSLLLEECRNEAERSGGRIFFESVRIATSPVQSVSADSLNAVRTEFFAALDDHTTCDVILKELDGVWNELPPAVREGLSFPCDADGVRALADEAWQLAAAAEVASRR